MSGWKKKAPFIAACAVIVILAFWYVQLTSREDPGAEGMLFAAKEDEEIQSILLKNAYGEFTFYQEDGAWMVSDGSEEFYTNADKMSLLTDALLHFKVKRELDQEQEAYGLKEPRASAEYTTTKGREQTVFIGSPCVDTNECYAKADGRKGVLITDSAGASQLLGSLAAFRTNEVFQIRLASLLEIAYTDASGQTISLARETEDGDWRLTGPVRAGARQLIMRELLSGLAGWSISGYPEEVPEMTQTETLVLTDGTGKTQKITLGPVESTSRYAMLDEDQDAVTLFASDVDLSALTVDSLIYEAPLSAAIADVSSLSVTIGEKDRKFEVDAGTETVTSGGKPIDYEAFVSFYTRYLLLLADGWNEALTTEGMPEEDAAASFETVLRDGSKLRLLLFEGKEDDILLMQYGGTDGMYMKQDRLRELENRLEDLGL